jgi:hypothetical protein
MKKTAAVRHARTLRTIPLEDLGNVRGGDDAGTTKRPELSPGTPADEARANQRHWIHP